MARGLYGDKNDFHSQEMGVGFEGAGEIVEVGPDVPESAIGEKVAFNQVPHSLEFQGTYR